MLLSILRNKKGSLLTVTAAALIAVIGFTGLVIDLGNVYYEKSKLQTTADAAVLAGGQELPDISLASSQTLDYISKNGENPAKAHIYYTNNNSRLALRITKDVSTFFMPVFGINSISIDAAAAGEIAPIGGPFDYAIFSGSKNFDLNITGGGWITKGSIHTNSNLNLTGGGFKVTEATEAMQQVNIIGGGYQIGSIQNNSPYIDMPDYSASIGAAASSAGQVYNGDKTITSGGFTIGNTIHIKGNLNITGGGFNSTGAILADGNMTINGGGINIAGSNQVCFYSKNGNITFTGGGANFNGVLYAPNGRITITGGGINFNGSIVAKEVVLLGGGINVNRSDNPIKSLSSAHVKLVQ